MIVAVSALGLLLVGATLGSDAPDGKSGGAAAVVFDLSATEPADTPAADIAERFARRVGVLSEGSIRVEITFWPSRFEPTTPSRHVEASAIAAVRSNEAQLAIVPSYAFRAQRVTTFDALHAPFLITSQAQATRATKGAIADRLQAGLAGIGLIGLGLVPEALYRPFGYLKPLQTPADFAGATIRAPSSKASDDLLRTLGARPIDLDNESIDTAVYSGFAKDTLPTARDEFPERAYTAGNIALYPKVGVIVVSNAAFAQLTAGQQRILRRAAADARTATIAATHERTEAAAYCKAGGTIVLAPASALRALRARAAPIVASLRSDPATSELIERIERIGAGGGAPPSCDRARARLSTESDSGQYPAEVRDPLLPPAGSYRRAFTAEQLRAAGAGDTDARRNEGVTTLTFYGQRWNLRFALEWQSSTVRPGCRGLVGLTRRLVELLWYAATPCNGFTAFGWRLEGGDLVIDAFDPRTEAGWMRKAYRGTWKRVDCTSPQGKTTSPEAYARIEQRLADLRQVGRRKVADRIRAARQLGDRGKAEYEDAKRERARLELKIAYFEERLRNDLVVPKSEPGSDPTASERSRPC